MAVLHWCVDARDDAGATSSPWSGDYDRIGGPLKPKRKDSQRARVNRVLPEIRHWRRFATACPNIQLVALHGKGYSRNPHYRGAGCMAHCRRNRCSRLIFGALVVCLIAHVQAHAANSNPEPSYSIREDPAFSDASWIRAEKQ
jgi:hypothetical protein